MRRLLVISGLALTFFLQGGQTQADWQTAKAKWNCFWDRVHVDWHRNNAWTEPFNLVDREAVRAPEQVMIDKGWQLQNTIPDQLFNAETQELTRAGEMKVQSILTQMPTRRRAVFVMRGSTPEITEARVKSVEKSASEMVRNASTLISVTDVVPREGSASYYDRVIMTFESTEPPARLPATDWTSASMEGS
ncbi:MAG: hypothetical protein ACYC3X_09600 [Pirellulaceae bacterium]